MPRLPSLAVVSALSAGALWASISRGADDAGDGRRVVRNLAYAAPVAEDPDAHTLFDLVVREREARARPPGGG